MLPTLTDHSHWGINLVLFLPLKVKNSPHTPLLFHSGLPFRAKLLVLASIPLLPLFLEASQAFVRFSQL